MKSARRSLHHLILVSLATVAVSFAMQAAEAATDDASTNAPATQPRKKKRTASPELRVAPNKTDMVDCAPGDTKCVEDSAKMETKPTDGAIRDQTN